MTQTYTLTVGDRVEGGEPGTQDYDTGTVIAVGQDAYDCADMGQRMRFAADRIWSAALVAWRTGTRTLCDAADLRPAEIGRA